MSIFNGKAEDIFNKKSDYPIGSICMFKTNIDPNEMYGGTWVRIKGKFIFGADDDTYPLGSEGGEATHTLTVDEMPPHNHNYNSELPGKEGGTLGGIKVSYGTAYDNVEVNGILNTGGGQPHNNMPPYVAFYIWAKVA